MPSASADGMECRPTSPSRCKRPLSPHPFRALRPGRGRCLLDWGTRNTHPKGRVGPEQSTRHMINALLHTRRAVDGGEVREPTILALGLAVAGFLLLLAV